MSISQSGETHKCRKHNFSCATIDEMHIHNTEFVHTHRGNAPCNRCKELTEFVITAKLKNKQMPILCAECKAELLEESS